MTPGKVLQHGEGAATKAHDKTGTASACVAAQGAPACRCLAHNIAIQAECTTAGHPLPHLCPTMHCASPESCIAIGKVGRQQQVSRV
jgi:hypothetical protein